MRSAIDLNCDMGEGFGLYKLGLDEELVKHITSANIACGFHAGDPTWMGRTVRLAEEHGVAIGAHPAFPDLQGFGRRDMALAPEEVKSAVIYQLGALLAFTGRKKLQHVKPHGAMYTRAAQGGELARAICQAVLQVDPEMVLVGLAGSPWVSLAREMGLRVAQEAFADRALNADGTLVPRSVPGSVIHDVPEVLRRTIRIATQGRVTAISGEEIAVEADTICLHGDTPGAVEMAAALRAGLRKAGIEIVPLGQLVEKGR